MLGIDPENDSVNVCLTKFRHTSPGLTLSISPQDAQGAAIGLLLFCSDPEKSLKIKAFADSLEDCLED